MVASGTFRQWQWVVKNGCKSGKCQPLWRLVLALVLVLALSEAAWAGWRLDVARFSRSVHAEIGCQDCHTDLSDREQHPDPARVRLPQQRAFDPEVCWSCHDDLQEDIDAGRHGDQTDADPAQLANCIGCHDPHYQGAPETAAAQADGEMFSAEDTACLSCHRQPASTDPRRVEKNRTFCLTCHQPFDTLSGDVPLLDMHAFDQGPHAAMDCLGCHPQADRYGHDRQPLTDCTACHRPHRESIAHEAHVGVACAACHLDGVTAVRRPGSAIVGWQRSGSAGTLSTVHQMQFNTPADCARCHYRANPIGASAVSLPAKGVLCMPCHAATLTAGDLPTRVGLIMFVIGLISMSTVWLAGRLPGQNDTGALAKVMYLIRSGLRGLFSRRLAGAFKILFWDVLLQRRLYRRSPGRWIIHGLIFWPFTLRFVWGLAALFSTSWVARWPLAWVLVNKNHPVTALIFDLSGLSILAGITLAAWRGSLADRDRVQGLPGQDRVALALIGGTVIVGFVLEAMRMAMTGTTVAAAWAPLGYGLSFLFRGMTGLSEVYAGIWYLHAVLTAGTVAYLPFSRLMHIIAAPIVMIANAADRPKDH